MPRARFADNSESLKAVRFLLAAIVFILFLGAMFLLAAHSPHSHDGAAHTASTHAIEEELERMRERLLAFENADLKVNGPPLPADIPTSEKNKIGN